MWVIVLLLMLLRWPLPCLQHANQQQTCLATACTNMHVKMRYAPQIFQCRAFDALDPSNNTWHMQLNSGAVRYRMQVSACGTVWSAECTGMSCTGHRTCYTPRLLLVTISTQQATMVSFANIADCTRNTPQLWSGLTMPQEDLSQVCAGTM